MNGPQHSDRAKDTAWADLSASEMGALIDESRTRGWREALSGVEERAPFFARRMRDLALLNWHVILLKEAEGPVLDVGCGLGSSVLGLAAYYDTVFGIEYLPDRLRYSALRAAQEERRNCHIARGDGHALPFRNSTFSLVTMNGVLEWAALYHDAASPKAAQLAFLEEARRILSEDGQLAVAIENRFAAESVLGMQDTHTGLVFVTVFPRWLARLWSRIWKGDDYRTFLYSLSGYEALFREAGFPRVRVFDLVSSYNDYDFVLDARDTASYRLLYRNDLVRGFHPHARALRALLGRRVPSWLGRIPYAYLVVAGQSPTSALDPDHAVWKVTSRWGLDAGSARFACKGSQTGCMAVITHGSEGVCGLLELSVSSTDPPLGAAMLPALARAKWGDAFRHVGSIRFRGAHVHAHLRR